MKLPCRVDFGASFLQPGDGDDDEHHSEEAAENNGGQLGGVRVTAVSTNQVHAIPDGAARGLHALIRVHLAPLTFIAKVTLAGEGVEGEGPLGVVTSASGGLAAAVLTRVQQHVDVQRQLHAEGAGGVLDPGVKGHVTGIVVWQIQGDFFADGFGAGGEADVGKSRIISTDVQHLELSS